MLWFSLLACGPSTAPLPPPDTDTGTAPPEVCTIEVDAETRDCADLNRWVEWPYSVIASCCECDAEFCSWAPEPDSIDDITAFPPDSGPELSFDKPLRIPDLSAYGSTQGSWLYPSDAGLYFIPFGGVTPLVEFSCERDLNTLLCRTPTRIRQTTYLALELRLEDQDGDGRADSGLARAIYVVSVPMQLPRREGFYGEVESIDEAGVANLPGPLLPTDPISLALSQPIDPDSIGSIVGEGRSWPLSPVTELGLAVDVAATPLLNWGESVQLSGLRDLSGNLFPATSSVVAPAPSAALGDLDFEDPAGWALRGTEFLDTVSILEPTSGDRFAYIRAQGTLVTELEIPDSASQLVFDFAVESSWTEHAVTLSLVDSETAERELLWELDPNALELCAGYPCMTWQSTGVDLRSWAGRRAFLRIDARELEPEDYRYLWTLAPPPSEARFAIDGLRFR